MRAEIIVIGNELLNGDRSDSHTATLATVLRQHGIAVAQAHVIPDDSDTIVRLLEESSARSELILVTGGLGPTDDDLTMAAAARFVERPLNIDAPTHERIKKHVLGSGRQFDEGHAKQALIPEGATALPNRKGSAPGVRIHVDGTTLFFFPGVPMELLVLTEDHLQPWLLDNVPEYPAQSRTLRTFGQTESGVAKLLAALEIPANVHLAYRVHFPEIQLTFGVRGVAQDEGQEILGRIEQEARERLGSIVFTDRPNDTFAQTIHQHLTALDPIATIAVAESCTGGLISSLITDVPGVSRWFMEGCVTYSNDAKTRLLGVQPDTLAEHGAVSEAVVREMARGVRQKAGADIGLAVTGISGPSGGSIDKPVGTTHFALDSDQSTLHKMRIFPFDRSRNRLVSAWSALDILRRYLLDFS